MSYISFNKSQLVNLEYALSKELVRSNRSGAFASTTIINCNTRKYHGLLIAPQPGIDGGNHVLLSTLDETVIQHNAEFNLGIHKFPGNVFSPKGHKYIRDFVLSPTPMLTYRLGGVVLTKERLFHRNDNRILIRYKLVDAHSQTKLRFRPFLAFRSIHSLTRENIYYDNKFTEIKNGVRIRMYPGYTPLFMQFSKPADYVHVPDWHYNIEYFREQERGYDYQEDLYVPGYFELNINKGESVIFSAGLSEAHPNSLKRIFNKEAETRTPRSSLGNCLTNAAEQFIVKGDRRTGVIAGYPWFGQWGRDTFISLPGLTMINKNFKTAKSVIRTMISEMKGPLFPSRGIENKPVYNSADTPLWFFWTLQQYAYYARKNDEVWKEYGSKMKFILEEYRKGTDYNIKMDDDGLIISSKQGYALTWMDAVVNEQPVTPRMGKTVEINALWYNAVCFALELARKAKDKSFIKKWEYLPELIRVSFISTFWNEERGYLADYVNNDYKDFSVRPNQVIATSLPHRVVDENIATAVLSIVQGELLTTRGLRSLSPEHPDYRGRYKGNQAERDMIYHQGTVWPWLLGHYAEAYLRLTGYSGLDHIKSLYKNFEDVMDEAGISTISEIYEGDPPHHACGAISQAWSVAEILRTGKLIKKYSRLKNK